MFNKVAFIGLGLIGSSLARVLRANQLTQTIVASSRSPRTLSLALDIGLIDAGYADAAEAVQDADLVVLAMPVCATQSVLAAIKNSLKASVIITDVGSTKGNVVAAAEDGVWCCTRTFYSCTSHCRLRAKWCFGRKSRFI